MESSFLPISFRAVEVVCLADAELAVAGPGEVDAGPGVPGGAAGLVALGVGAGVLGVQVSA